MKLKNNMVLKLIIIAVFCFLAVYIGITVTSNLGKSNEEVSEEKTEAKLDKLIRSSIHVQEVQARKGNVTLVSDPKEELPDISKYPLTAEGSAAISIEIFATAEKAGTGNDGWLNEMAEAFNEGHYSIGDQTVSVSIRSIASGMGMDYITSGKYLPDAFSPSNELYGEMLAARGVRTELVSKRLVGNVAGILLTKDTQKKLTEKYGSINMKTITSATAANELAMGYTNPLASATGLNFLISTLNAYDPANPLSDTAAAGFEQFQINVPFVAYTTLQMRDAAESGVLDGMILEYQTYVNTRELRDYQFTPFGVRHDNPLYAIGSLSKEKQKALKLFADFCAGEEAQSLASEYGFNNLDDYSPESSALDGNSILDAQSLWKDKKDSGKPVTAVFVADTSGSMGGDPLNNLKKSLINAAQYINDENYIGLVSYNTDVYINLPIAKFDLNQRSYFTGAVEDLYAGGETASFDALCVALQMLNNAKKENPDTKLILFLLSDGETNLGYSLNDVRGIISEMNIPVYTIGYNADISALNTISSINEAASINADSDDVIYKLKSLFNSQM